MVIEYESYVLLYGFSQVFRKSCHLYQKFFLFGAKFYFQVGAVVKKSEFLENIIFLSETVLYDQLLHQRVIPVKT